ncbi:hypothetical protein BJ742DRAFT_818906 [Cladochytrium replicatum]|nr:hypothetical protein BJ742DRAFT_818906 [Cladochytrium replicatum]
MAKPRGSRRSGKVTNGENNTTTKSLSDRFREIQSAPATITVVTQTSVRRTGVPNTIAQRLGSGGQRAGVTAGRITKKTGVVGGRGGRAGGANSRVAAAAAAAVAATGRGRGRGGRGGRGRGRGRGVKFTKNSLDAELDAYMLKDEKYAQNKLDADLDSYMNANDEDTPMETS